MASLNKIYYGYIASFSSPWTNHPNPFVPPGSLITAWDNEGVKVMSIRFDENHVHLVLETDGGLKPDFIAQRLKGRLQHTLKKDCSDFPGFTRDFFLRSLGQNDKNTVAGYIQEQVNHSDLVDPLYRVSLNKLRYKGDSVSVCASSRHGVYELFLHLVMVVSGRYRMRSDEAKGVAESVLDAVERNGLGAVQLSVMPDHLHLLTTYSHSMSPVEVLAKLKEGSGEVMKQSAFWNEGGYTGTVGPYCLAVALKMNADAGGWHRGLGMG